MKKLLQAGLFLICSFTLSAQMGEIQGKVTDEKGEPVPFAYIFVIRDLVGKQPTSKATKANVNGFYTLKGMNPGTYNLMAKSLGKPNAIEIGVQVYAGRPKTVNFVMEQKSNTKKVVNIVAKGVVKKEKLIDVFDPKKTTIGAEEVKNSAVRDVATIAATSGGVVQNDVGEGLNVGGGRGEGLVYFVDGVKMTGSAAVPPNQIAQMEVITSGVPAKYGDANAGVISIITKGPSDKIHGSVEGLTSQYLDPYGYKLGNFSLTGPIFRAKTVIDSSNPAAPFEIKGEPVLGFMIGGEYEYLGDVVPTANGNWKVKDDVYERILNDPYVVSDDGTQLVLRQGLINLNDLERTNSHQNTSGRNIRFNGKLDWKVIKNSTNITLGARIDDNEFNSYVQRYSLLNYQNNPIFKNKSYNAYIRLYQPLFNSEKQEKKLIKNTTMILQFDATLSGRDFKSPVGEFNPWHYGYIGKFTERRKFDYERNTEVEGEKVYYAPGQYRIFKDFYTANISSADSVMFQVSGINPLASNQTDAFIRLYNNTLGKGDNGHLTSVDAVQNAGGDVNGFRSSQGVHDLFFPAARIYNGFGKQNNRQFRLTGTFNFDIIPSKVKKKGDIIKHTIEAGFELEQRVNRSYGINNPIALWNTVHTSLLNSHLSPDNERNYNPLLIMRGGTVRMRLQDYVNQDSVAFSAFDTLLYDTEVSNGQQTNFSRNLRNDLFGGDSLTRINVHELDPDKMKLEWFSADELINNNFYGGVGFDVYGNSLPTSTSFTEFFTAKDDNGNFKRHIAPIMPRYAAGYIQDRFQLKDLALNVGFRVDYFDPNSYTLRDPYVPQGGRTKSEVANFRHPESIPGDAVVYVDKEVDPTRVTGYRHGSRWFNKDGNEVPGHQLIEAETGGTVRPYLKGDTKEERDRRDMTKSNFDPDLMFRKTRGQFAFAPRVNFTFKIDTFSLLFAHYDVLNQRPFGVENTALNYYNLLGRRASSFINNPDLEFSSTSDLELGFKQRITSRSALTINFQYREYSNQVAVARINGAYPGGYNTFSNTDFSTVKSIGLAFEQRRVKNLRMKANYTMSFADGTGSSRTAQLSLVNAGLAPLRVIYPLNWDTRHNLNLNLNYRFDSRNPYNKSIPGFLKGIGLNLDFSLMSGRPFTLQVKPTPTAFMNSTARPTNLGDINSGRKPWRFRADLKLDKDFKFKIGKIDSSQGGDLRRVNSLNVYLQITNLFNSMNVLEVYRYTGDPNTDGYLSSPEGNLEYTNREGISRGYGQAFRDLYNVALEIPENGNSMFIRPRVIQLGAVLSF